MGGEVSSSASAMQIASALDAPKRGREQHRPLTAVEARRGLQPCAGGDGFGLYARIGIAVAARNERLGGVRRQHLP